MVPPLENLAGTLGQAHLECIPGGSQLLFHHHKGAPWLPLLCILKETRLNSCGWLGSRLGSSGLQVGRGFTETQSVVSLLLRIPFSQDAELEEGRARPSAGTEHALRLFLGN